MATETLGAHLRNLLSPYKTLISICKETNFKFSENTLKTVLENCEENFDRMLDFSNSDKMEDNLWRDENE